MAKKAKAPEAPKAEAKLDKAKRNMGTFFDWRGRPHPAYALWDEKAGDYMVHHADSHEKFKSVPLSKLELHRNRFEASGESQELEAAESDA